jgi:hypothetical protein
VPKSNEELNDWKEEIQKARKQRGVFMIHWNYWEQVYDDNLWGNSRFEQSGIKSSQNKDNFRPQINELESIVMNILPRIHFYAPVFEITSDYNEPMYRFSAYIYELLAGILYEKLGMYENMEEAIVDCLILGGGLHKVGYSYEVESSNYQLGDATAGDPEIASDMVFSGYVSPKDVLWDHRVTSWKDKRWFAEEIIKPVEEVKKSNLYSARDLKGNLTLSGEVEGIERQIQENRKGDLVRLVEIHDLASSKIITIADGHNKILRKDDDYGIELYDPLTFIPSRPRRFWGKSIAQSIEEHMINLSKIYHYMLSHSKGAGLTKVLAESSLITPEAIRKLESSNDFEVIPIDGISQGTPIQELKLSGTGADWYNNYTVVDSAIRYLSGVTQQERGRHETGVATAFEVARLAEASDVRNRARILKVNKFTANVMTKLLTIASNNFSTERIADMVGLPTENSVMIVPFDRMKLKVQFGSTAIEARREQLNKVVAFSQLAAQFGIQINPQGALELISGALGLELKESMLLLGGGGGQPSPDAQGRPPAASAPRSNLGNMGAELPRF